MPIHHLHYSYIIIAYYALCVHIQNAQKYVYTFSEYAILTICVRICCRIATGKTARRTKQGRTGVDEVESKNAYKSENG